MKADNKTDDEVAQAALDEALYQACAAGTVEEVRALLARGANPNAPHWETPWYDEDGGMREDYYPELPVSRPYSRELLRTENGFF